MQAISELFLSSPNLALAPTIATNPDAHVTVESQPAMDPDRRRFFVHVHCDDFDAFDDALAEDYTVTEPLVLSESEGFRIYRLTLTDDVITVSPRMVELGGMVLTMASRGHGWRVELRISDRDTLVAFRSFCEANDIDYTLERLYQTDPGPDSGVGLTESQRETLLAAYDAGYFEVPRAASQADLAARLGVSDSAVSQRVRRAVAALVANTLAETRPEPRTA